MEHDYLLKCIDCGEAFFTEGEKQFYEHHKLFIPKRCKKCRQKVKQQKEQELNRLKQIEEEKALISDLSKSGLTVSDKNGIKTIPEKTLYVIGNGFDLMHGVKSSYYNFRDSLGKRNPLRQALENYLDCDDLWWNLEESLNHLDYGIMLESMDDFLDIYNAYDDDSQMADYYAAIDMAMEPADIISNDLPKRFRAWINSLKLPTDAKHPLRELIAPKANYISFNYTEFLEVLYGAENVCYIHGSRKDKKSKLILGHQYDAPEHEYDYNIPHFKNDYKNGMFEAAINDATEHLSWYDEATTKNCKQIISDNAGYFQTLAEIEYVVIIGHSLSFVDWEYYKEIVRQNNNPDSITWIISFHGRSDLKNIKAFKEAMNITNEKIIVFRT